MVGGEGRGVRDETAGYSGPLGKDLDFFSEEMGSHGGILSRAVVGSDRSYSFPLAAMLGLRGGVR